MRTVLGVVMSAAVVFAGLARSSPVPQAGCTVNVGRCSGGSCTVNYGTCEDGGNCLVTVGRCDNGEASLVAL